MLFIVLDVVEIFSFFFFSQQLQNMDKQIYFWGRQKYFVYLFVGNEMTNETLLAFFSFIFYIL